MEALETHSARKNEIEANVGYQALDLSVCAWIAEM